MSDTKHTPGPWIVVADTDKGPHSSVEVRASDGWTIAYFVFGDNTRRIVTPEEALANARLAVATAALLPVAKLLWAELEVADDENRRPQFSLAEINQIQTTIAQATPPQPSGDDTMPEPSNWHAAALRVVANHTAEVVDGITLDATSAALMLQLTDGLPADMRAKVHTLDLETAADLCFTALGQVAAARLARRNNAQPIPQPPPRLVRN